MKAIFAVVSLLPVLAILFYAFEAVQGHQEFYTLRHMRNSRSTTTAMMRKLTVPQARAANGHGGSEKSSSQCSAVDCDWNVWQKGLKQITGAKLDPYPGLMDGQQVAKVCAVYYKTRLCLDKCPAGGQTTLTRNLLALPKYMCNDSSLKRHAQCIYEAVLAVNNTCQADNQCGKYGKKVVEGTPSVDNLKDYYKNMCQYMTCQRDCVKPTIVRKCTSVAYTAVAGLPRKGAEYLKTVFETHGMPLSFPQECSTIIST